MTDTKELSATRRQQVETAKVALLEIEQESENRRVALEQSEQRIKLLELEINVLKNENIKSRDNEAIATGRSEEDRAQRVKAETLLHNIVLLATHAEPQKQLPAPRKNLDELLRKAVGAAVQPQKADGIEDVGVVAVRDAVQSH